MSMPVEELPPRPRRRLPGDVVRLGRSMMGLRNSFVSQECSREEEFFGAIRVVGAMKRGVTRQRKQGRMCLLIPYECGKESCTNTERAC